MMLNKLFQRYSNDELALGRTPGAVRVAGVTAENYPSHHHASAEPKPKSQKKTSPAIAVIGAKGGAGATTIAVNLATAFALRDQNTTLIDAHLQQPTVAHALGIKPPHSLMELLGRKSECDEQLFRVCTVAVDASIKLNFLSPPLDGAAGVKSNLSELSETFAQVRHHSDLWIIDMPGNLDKHLVTMIDGCTKIVLVFEATVSGVATCRRWLDVFQELGYKKERIICVLNRAGSKFRAVEDQLDPLFADRSFVRIPNASTLLWQSSTAGVPALLMQPKDNFSRAIVKLGDVISASITQE